MDRVAVAVILLPLAGILLSYMAESRRGISQVILFCAWLDLLACLVLLGDVVAGAHATHSQSVTFWSFAVTQTPYGAAPRTSLSELFQVGLGFNANPTTSVLAVVAVLASLLAQLQTASQFRRDQTLGRLMRLSALLVLGVLLLLLAQGLFQVLIGFGVCGLAAGLLVGSARGGRAGGAARSAYLLWRTGALALLLAVAFLYVKFSGPVAQAASAAQAAVKHGPKPASPDVLNLVALDHLLATVGRGAVHGVGGRSLALAAALVLVAVVCAVGLVPWHSQAQNQTRAPGAAGGLVLAVAGGLMGVGLLFQAFPLLRWAPGALPALVVLAALTAALSAALACRETRLRRLAAWLGLSQISLALLALGLGSPPAALATLISATLSTVALLGVVSSLSLNQRVDRVSQLGAAWSLARPAVLVLLAALAAVTGVVGLGTFFGHLAVLAAAFGSSTPGAPALPRLFSGIGAAGAIVALVLVALATARVALQALGGELPADPRQARQVRRQLTREQGLGPLWPSLAATVLALLSGLVSLPGVGFELGAFLVQRRGMTGLPLQGEALLVVLILPLLALLAMGLARHRVGGGQAETDPGWRGWLDGTLIAVAVDRVGPGLVGRGAQLVQLRVLQFVADLGGQGLRSGAAVEVPREVGGGFRWQWGSGVLALAALGLVIAIVVWASGHPGAGGP